MKLKTVFIVSLLSLSNIYSQEQNEDGNTALILLARHGHLDEVKLLIDTGADVDAENLKGETALTWAAFSGHRPNCHIPLSVPVLM